MPFRASQHDRNAPRARIAGDANEALNALVLLCGGECPENGLPGSRAKIRGDHEDAIDARP